MNQRIKKLRQTLGLTQKVFGEKIGLKQNSIALIESGKRNMSDTAVIALYSAFDVNPDWIWNGTGEMFLQKTPDQERAELAWKFESVLFTKNDMPTSPLKRLCLREILDFDTDQWYDLLKAIAVISNNTEIKKIAWTIPLTSFEQKISTSTALRSAMCGISQSYFDAVVDDDFSDDDLKHMLEEHDRLFSDVEDFPLTEEDEPLSEIFPPTDTPQTDEDACALEEFLSNMAQEVKADEES